jgi:amino acid transporter
MEEFGSFKERKEGLAPYLSPLGAWALAFGCAVGWGAFVMPGNVFLLKAGPLGTSVGMAVGALIMLLIGVNYHFMMNRFPDAGGAFAFTKNVLGYLHFTRHTQPWGTPALSSSGRRCWGGFLPESLAIILLPAVFCMPWPGTECCRTGSEN